MSIEIKDGAVIRDGENVGTIGDGGIFVPAAGLHWTKKRAVEDFLAGESGKPIAEKPPEEVTQSVANAATASQPERWKPEFPVFYTDATGNLHRIEIKDDVVWIDGEDVGKFDKEQGGAFASFVDPAPVLQGEPPATLPQAPGSPEPVKDPQYGDLTPAYIEWFRANHSAEEFAKRYHHRGVN
ncbi:hypothetical protein TSACC_3684 [Terrimicrobium sacchariphilum]|uniref:Uncharacterized protein n=1 Tax=Terrimicrobium sacchariphilum TaxID=690879 RepID=A0A146GET9_TERSA|nr:hypothetical protein [Terrimicrobium sacchariphilum]GAT35613.1 hypothetical protein TSACC_3684 [Terrimicrobium sacchariphilum]